MKLLIKKLTFGVVTSFLPVVVLAGGGGLTGGATELTQLANNTELGAVIAENARQVSNQITQINNQILQYQNMVNNTLAIPTHIWGQAETALSNLANVVQTGEALAYSMSNLDFQFKSKFNGYDDHLVKNYNRAEFTTEYKGWSATNRDSIRSALLSANLQADQFATENSTLNAIQNISQSATGRLQAIQAGSLIAAQQVRQTQKLRQLIMSQIQMIGVAEASVQDEKDRNQAINDNYYQAPVVVFPNDGARF